MIRRSSSLIVLLTTCIHRLSTRNHTILWIIIIIMIILFFAGAFCGLYINLYDIHVSRNIQKKKNQILGWSVFSTSKQVPGSRFWFKGLEIFCENPTSLRTHLSPPPQPPTLYTLRLITFGPICFRDRGLGRDFLGSPIGPVWLI